jgi:cysteine desulfuration protein SufE
MRIKEIQDDIVEEFALFEDWMQKYEYMIELGKSIDLIDSKNKVDANLIKGCQSKLWLFAELKNGKIIFSADSEAIITKGIAAILLRVFF